MRVDVDVDVDVDMAVGVDVNVSCPEGILNEPMEANREQKVCVRDSMN